jgi:transcriptional regulator with XRE-family HTH domain
MCNVPFCGIQRQRAADQVNTQEESTDLVNVPARLRSCRKKMGVKQAEFAALGGVVLNSQSRYETGATEPNATYLARLASNGVDVLWILTGTRAGDRLSRDQAELLDAYEELQPQDRAALRQIASSLSGRPSQSAMTLPSAEALAEAFGAFLEGSPGLDGAELVHELATRLPIILRGAGAEIAVPASETGGTPPEEQQAPDAGHREVPRARRT